MRVHVRARTRACMCAPVLAHRRFLVHVRVRARAPVRARVRVLHIVSGALVHQQVACNVRAQRNQHLENYKHLLLYVHYTKCVHCHTSVRVPAPVGRRRSRQDAQSCRHRRPVVENIWDRPTQIGHGSVV